MLGYWLPKSEDPDSVRRWAKLRANRQEARVEKVREKGRLEVQAPSEVILRSFRIPYELI